MKTQQQCRSCGKAVYDGHVHACYGLSFSDLGSVPPIILDKKLRVTIPVSTLAKIYANLSTLSPEVIPGQSELMQEILDILDGN